MQRLHLHAHPATSLQLLLQHSELRGQKSPRRSGCRDGHPQWTVGDRLYLPRLHLRLHLHRRLLLQPLPALPQPADSHP